MPLDPLCPDKGENATHPIRIVHASFTISIREGSVSWGDIQRALEAIDEAVSHNLGAFRHCTITRNRYIEQIPFQLIVPPPNNHRPPDET